LCVCVVVCACAPLLRLLDESGRQRGQGEPQRGRRRAHAHAQQAAAHKETSADDGEGEGSDMRAERDRAWYHCSLLRPPAPLFPYRRLAHARSHGGFAVTRADTAQHGNGAFEWKHTEGRDRCA
jgi:hypothetical protein